MGREKIGRLKLLPRGKLYKSPNVYSVHSIFGDMCNLMLLITDHMTSSYLFCTHLAITVSAMV